MWSQIWVQTSGGYQWGQSRSLGRALSSHLPSVLPAWCSATWINLSFSLWLAIGIPLNFLSINGLRIPFTVHKVVPGKEDSACKTMQPFQTSQLSGSICWSLLFLEEMKMLKIHAEACSLSALVLSGSTKLLVFCVTEQMSVLGMQSIHTVTDLLPVLGGRTQWSSGPADLHVPWSAMWGQKGSPVFKKYIGLRHLRIHLPENPKKAN